MIIRCPNCNKEYEPVISKVDPKFNINYDRWKIKRELIQNVWPNFSLNEREQLQTGICSENCWSEFLGVEE